MKQDDSTYNNIDGLGDDNERFVLLARMAHNRKKVTCPDAEMAWQSFKAQQSPANPPKRHPNKSHVWQLVLAACAGAAAMLALMWVLGQWPSYKTSNAHEELVVALAHKAEPQHVTWTSGNESMAMPQGDSVSFKRAQPAVIQNAHTEESSSQPHSTPTKMQKLATPRGMDFKVILPDGSEVWLNAESTIEFPSAFTDTERRVLLKGEAYFKVTRNEQCPFIVCSDQMKVKVLGTEFNFKSYASENPHVSLVKGMVEVCRPDEETPAATLQPGEDASWDENGKVHIQEVDTYGVTQWVSGFFYFDNQPLVNVLCELGRWYNLGVVFRNKEHLEQKMHFSASRSESIDEAIRNLNSLRKFKVSIDGNNLVVD